MAFPYKTWQRLDSIEQTEILNHANKLLDNLDAL